jgi:hypothetical protein
MFHPELDFCKAAFASRSAIFLSMTEHQIPGVIEIRVASIAQIFNSFDPSPFHERDLDRGAEDFVLDWARELPRDQKIAITIYLPRDAAESNECRGATEAIATYFRRSAEASARRLREHFRLGWRYLAIGIAILAACLSGSAALGAIALHGGVTDIAREGLVILGWVANWKPLEIFLYDWQPIERQETLYRRLAAADIQIIPV